MRQRLGTLRTLIRQAFTTASVKTVRIGQNDAPMQNDLPQIQIWPVSTEVNLSGTAKDEQVNTMAVRAIVNIKENLKQQYQHLDTISSMLHVIDIMEKRESSGAFSTASILGVFRNSPELNEESLYNDDINVDYTALDGLGFPNAVAETNVSYVSRNLTK
jgi:hypothetical protein